MARRERDGYGFFNARGKRSEWTLWLNAALWNDEKEQQAEEERKVALL